jgi:endoglucanase
MKSTAAALDFAAVMAQSARIFRPFARQLPGLSDSCLRAATSAWQWAVAHPDVLYDQQQMNQQSTPVITTGAYGDRHVKDEKYWAAVELFVTTGDRKYEQSLRSILPQTFMLPSWGQVGTLGDYTLLRFRKKLKSDKPLLAGIQKRLIMFANGLLDHPDAAYQTVMGGNAHDFIWGSNAVAANQGILMIQAYLLTRDKKYLKAARGNLDYLLGRNATGYCFVTGFGSKSPMHPHHRPSVADGIKEPVPGLLVGGPNPGQQDHCPTYPSRIADESYTDDDRAYACNEIAINWNAPMVYLVNALEAFSAQQ